MGQNYSLNGVYVSKEAWEKARGIFVEPVEVKKETIVEKVVNKVVKKKTTKKA